MALWESKRTGLEIRFSGLDVEQEADSGMAITPSGLRHLYHTVQPRLVQSARLRAVVEEPEAAVW
jgi:hypothetical protein